MINLMNRLNDIVLIRFRPLSSGWFSATLILLLGILVLMNIDNRLGDLSAFTGVILIVMGLIRIITLTFLSFNITNVNLSRACLVAGVGCAVFWGHVFWVDMMLNETLFNAAIHLWLFLMALWNITTMIIDL